MTSILTNPSALTALQTLTQTMKSLQKTQGEISTGLRIASAADNAAYWSIATTMKSDSSVLSTVSDALNMGASTLDVASTAMDKAITIMGKIKQDLGSAAQPGVDRNKIQADITQQQSTLRAIATSASFNGQNWLSVDSAQSGFNYTKSFISSYARDTAGSIDVGYIQVNIAQVALLDKNLGGTIAAYDAANFPTTAMTATGTAAAGSVTGTLGWNDTTKVFTITDDTGTASDITETTLDVTFDGKAATLTYTAGDDTTTPVTPQNFKIEYEAGGVLDTVDASTVGSYTDSNGAVTTSADTGTGVSIMTMNISTLSDSAADMATLNAFTQQVDTTIANMTTAASDVGAVKSRIGLQQSFVTSLKDSIDMGVGSLVDADMNQESTRLQALQVQQQLGIQSLSIANQSAQAILKLFG